MVKFFLRSLAIFLAFFLALGAFIAWQDYREARQWEALWEAIIEMEMPE